MSVEKGRVVHNLKLALLNIPPELLELLLDGFSCFLNSNLLFPESSLNDIDLAFIVQEVISVSRKENFPLYLILLLLIKLFLKGWSLRK